MYDIMLFRGDLVCIDESNCKALFEGLERVEVILAKSPYLIEGSNQWTEADIRLVTTIVRFGK